MTTELQIPDLEKLQSSIRALTSQLKKISLDNASIQKHAAEIIQKQEDEKDRIKREKDRKNFKLTTRDVEEFVEEVFQSLDEIFEKEEDEGSFIRRRYWEYDTKQYLLDNHGELIMLWANKFKILQNELREELINIIPKKEVS